MGVHEEELVWLAARVRQIRAEEPFASAAPIVTIVDAGASEEDALMQEYHRRSKSANGRGTSRSGSVDQRGLSSKSDTSTRLNAERDLQYTAAQGSNASLQSTAGQDNVAG